MSKQYDFIVKQLNTPEILGALSADLIATPFPLVEEMLDKLSIDWSNPNLKFLDPACGRGTFLIAIKNRLLAALHTEQHIVENMLYGVDIDDANAKFVAGVLRLGDASKYDHNIECANTLTKEWTMKFDVVVGNPPYQEGDTGSNKTLFDKFYYKATELADTVLLIAPTMWLTSNKKRLINLREFLVSNGLTDVYELNSQQAFGVSVNMLGYTIQTVHTLANNYNFHKLNGTVVACSGHAAPVLTGDSTAVNILDKVSSIGSVLDAHNSQLRGLNREGTCGNGEASAVQTSKHVYKMINKVNGGTIEYAWTCVSKNKHIGCVRVAFGDLSSKNSLGVITVLDDTSSTTSRSVVYIPVNNKQEGESLKSYLDSKLFRFVLPMRRPGTNNAVGLLNNLCRPPLVKIWTDRDLYEHFNLSKEEIALIEATVK